MKYYVMFSTEVELELKDVLGEISSNFEDNLKRAFRNECVRNHRLNTNKFVYSLQDGFLQVANTIIELRNVKLPWVPDFRINQLHVDLGMLCLDVNLNLGSLSVETDYEANDFILQKILPVTHSGKATITFANVILSGKIGLLIEDDSLVPKNYDLTYDPMEITVKVTYTTDGEHFVENEITRTHIEDTLAKAIWPQLKETLTDILVRQLSEVVVEFSLQELLLDQDELLRAREQELVARANRVLDSLLCSAKDWIVVNNYREIGAPAFNVIYKGKPTGLHLGKFQTENGYLKDLVSLSRSHSWSLFEDPQTLVIYGYLDFREFKHGFQSYTSEFEDVKINGTINSTIYKSKIFVKIIVKKTADSCTTVLADLRFSTLKDIDIDASGLASLSWLAPRLKSWVIGNLRYKSIPVLEKYIKEAFGHAIDSTNCLSLVME